MLVYKAESRRGKEQERREEDVSSQASQRHSFVCHCAYGRLEYPIGEATVERSCKRQAKPKSFQSNQRQLIWCFQSILLKRPTLYFRLSFFFQRSFCSVARRVLSSHAVPNTPPQGTPTSFLVLTPSHFPLPRLQPYRTVPSH